ncbi:PadR family transcriptional regulator [Leifsonia sp. F6_8S_P_1B]|uniref:PadR family transcriptional regulator n=1 Tax=Leifsonia williamsii TaxID=3035919 RepID=A0ABT8K815_9MICO|nr:PadR family transcriptional regulator [Leifsonia williamsii]MDN4613585.1 PadR family transcriptional regulator [Leifsonia williamsii]
MTLTPAELTVLGLIVEEPRHGYDLEQVIETRGIRRWTDIGFSSIYYLLAKLERRGLVAAEADRPGAKARRVFHATEEGRRVAGQEALAFIEDARPVPHPLLVGLANLPLIPESHYAAALGARLGEIEQRIHAIEEAERAQAPLPPAAHEVFSYSLSLLEAERSWLAQRVQAPHE